MSALKEKKNDRLDFRLSSSDKEKLKLAMRYLGEPSMGEFILKNIMPEVDRILKQKQKQKISLQEQAWSGFLSMLESPKPASKQLKDAMKEYKNKQGV